VTCYYYTKLNCSENDFPNTDMWNDAFTPHVWKPRETRQNPPLIFCNVDVRRSRKNLRTQISIGHYSVPVKLSSSARTWLENYRKPPTWSHVPRKNLKNVVVISYVTIFCATGHVIIMQYKWNEWFCSLGGGGGTFSLCHPRSFTVCITEKSRKLRDTLHEISQPRECYVDLKIKDHR